MSCTSICSGSLPRIDSDADLYDKDSILCHDVDRPFNTSHHNRSSILSNFNRCTSICSRQRIDSDADLYEINISHTKEEPLSWTDSITHQLMSCGLIQEHDDEDVGEHEQMPEPSDWQSWIWHLSAGRVEQGLVKPGDECIFLPTNTASMPCKGKVFTVEMHHKQQPEAGAGDNVGLNVKGLDKGNMPRVGDVMIKIADKSISTCSTFEAVVQILDHPGELKVGYTPIGFVRTGRAAVRMDSITWKMGKSTGGQKAESPPFVKANEMASIVFKPQNPFVCDTFKNCEGLGRIAIMEGNGVVMLGKVMKVTSA